MRRVSPACQWHGRLARTAPSEHFQANVLLHRHKSRGVRRWVFPHALLGVSRNCEGEEQHPSRLFLIPTHRRVYFKTDRKSTRLNSSHPSISYAVFCLKKKIQGAPHVRPHHP